MYFNLNTHTSMKKAFIEIHSKQKNITDICWNFPTL